MNANEIQVTIGQAAYTTTIVHGKNTVIADEPEELGGQDQGFNPIALFLSSLGSCKAITLKMYADRKKWNLEEAQIKLSYEIEKNGSEQITKISCFISLLGDLDETQKDRLMKVAEKCPVHKMMTNPITISSHLNQN